MSDTSWLVMSAAAFFQFSKQIFPAVSPLPFVFGNRRQLKDVQLLGRPVPAPLQEQVVPLEQVTIFFNSTQTTVPDCKLDQLQFLWRPLVLLEWLCFCIFGESSVCKQEREREKRKQIMAY